MNSAVVAEAGANVATLKSWVVFACDETLFGIPLDAVSEIIPARPFTRLPGAGREVCGLAGVRGRVVTVFDFGAVVGMRSASSVTEHRLLLLEIGTHRIGAAVERVVDIAPARIEPASAANGSIGTGHMHDTTFTALDPYVLLSRLLRG